MTLEEVIDFVTVLLEDFVDDGDGEFEILEEEVTVELILELGVILTETDLVTETEDEMLGEILTDTVVVTVAELVGVDEATIKSTSASTPLSLIDSSLLQRDVITRPVEYTILCFGITGPETF